MFLDGIDNNLFRPLVSKNVRLYGLGLWAIYRQLVKEQIAGECTPQEARGIIRRELSTATQDEIEWADEEDDEDGAGDGFTSMASQIYTVLRRVGWIKEMDDAGYRRIVYMPLMASRLLVAINNSGIKRNFSMGATFQSIYLGLNSAINTPREAASQISVAASAARSLYDELSTVAASTREISHKMREEKKGASLFHAFFKEFMEEALGNYDHIKITSNPHRYRTETLTAVHTLTQDQEKLRLIAEIIAQEKGSDDYVAEQKQLDDDLHLISKVFFGVPELMDRIENYRSITTRRTREAMQYAYKAIPDIGIKIESMIGKLALIEGDNDTDIPAPLIRDEYVAAHRAQKPRYIEKEAIPTTRKPKIPKAWDIAFDRANNEYLQRRADNPERLEKFLVREMSGKRSITSCELNITSLDDLLAFMQLRDLLYNCLPIDHAYEDLSDKYRVSPIPGVMTDNKYLKTPAIQIDIVGDNKANTNA
jgi:hypothetical protein